MNSETKRLFIPDLPDEISEQELRDKFAIYGQVENVEIKIRNILGPKHKYLNFAYVNLIINNKSLQKCFEDFQTNAWKNHHIDLQIAKESFLSRLQKEREERQSGSKTDSSVKEHYQHQNGNVPAYKVSNESAELLKNGEEEQISFTSEKKCTEERDYPVLINDKQKRRINSNDSSDICYNITRKKVLKIESVGKEPIFKSSPKIVKSKDPKRMEADIKRINSVIQMKKEYNLQKTLIKTALSNVELKPKNKIVFNEDDEYNDESGNQINMTQKGVDHKSLFSDDEDDKDDNLTFEVKEQFQGKAGQKLLNLQSKYKNDSRFMLDSRFLEDEKESSVNEVNEIVHSDGEELTIEKEKQKEFEILEQVLGTKFQSHPKIHKNCDLPMVRYDPTLPEHSKFEIRQPELVNTKKKKKKDKVTEIKSDMFENNPEVSKEHFYKVTDNLKEALLENESFSLLNLYGKVNDDEIDEQHDGKTSEIVKFNTNRLIPEQNPFRYDSSDDNSDQEDIDNQEKNAEVKKTDNSGMCWNEAFFFKNDDYRLQEGLDFIKRLEQGEKDDFKKVRANLKGIVKAKVKNNQRKNNPFRKKLGGSARKKKNRIIKALKR